MRSALAGSTGAFAAFCAAAGLDWIWELPGVAAIAFLLLGGLLGPGSRASPSPERSRRWTAIAAALLIAGPFLILEGSIFVAAERLQTSQRAAGEGDLRAAAARADDAAHAQPWASTPRLQLALVAELAGDARAARAAIEAAIDRDSQDWRLRVVAARIERSAGRPDEAEEHLRDARALNPRSRLIEGLSAP